MKSERIVQNEVRLAASRNGFTLWRNNVGVGYQGEVSVRAPDYIVIKGYRRVNFGLAEGSSDLIGFREIEITQEMVGTTVAVFSAVEVKSRNGKLTQRQKNFLRCVDAAGGIAVLARSAEDIPS